VKKAEIETLVRLGAATKTSGGRVDVGEKSYRERRGKTVEIPPEWVGEVVSERKIRRRPSKGSRKASRLVSGIAGCGREKGRMDRERTDRLNASVGEAWHSRWRRGIGHPRNLSERHLRGRRERLFGQDE